MGGGVRLGVEAMTPEGVVRDNAPRGQVASEISDRLRSEATRSANTVVAVAPAVRVVIQPGLSLLSV